jgi:hypothetical protein
MKWYEVQPEIYKGKLVKRAGWADDHFIEYGRCSGGNGRAIMIRKALDHDFYHASCEDLMAEDWIITGGNAENSIVDEFREFLENWKTRLEDLLLINKNDHELSFKRSITLNTVNICIEHLNEISTKASEDTPEVV